LAIDKLTTVTKKPPAKPESVDDETSKDEEPNEPNARKMVKTKKPSPSSLQPSISSLEPGAFVKDTADEGELAKYKLTTGNKKPTAKPKSADDETSKDEELNETTARKKVKTKKPSPSSLPPSISSLEPGEFFKDTADEGEVAKDKLTTGNKKPTAKPESDDGDTS